MIYGYIRVSSDKQTVENQRFEINNFCSKENIKIDGFTCIAFDKIDSLIIIKF